MRKFDYTVLEVPTNGFWGKIDHGSLKSKLNELGVKVGRFLLVTMQIFNMVHHEQS